MPQTHPAPSKSTASKPILVSDLDRQRLELLIQDFKANRYEGADYISALDRELKRATFVPPNEIPADIVTMNSKVRLRISGVRQALTYTLVYPDHADIDADRISILAPLATAVLGTRVGDCVEQELPGGMKQIVVEKLIYQPESAGDYLL